LFFVDKFNKLYICEERYNCKIMVMKADDKKVKKSEPKKKLGRLELAKTKLNGAFGYLHLLLAPHEISASSRIVK